MKLNKIALAVIASAVVPVVATAGVTVTPVMLGYQYNDQALEAQKNVLQTGMVTATTETGAFASQGVGLDNGLYTGAAVGIELTPATQLQVEYGATNVNARGARVENAPNFDGKQTTISGNLLVGVDQFTGNTDAKFKPYLLVGGGQSETTIKSKDPYVATRSTTGSNNINIPATAKIPNGGDVAKSVDKVANVGLGARMLVSDAVALRGEARGVYNIDKKWWEGLALAGLEVTLGGRLAPTVEVPDYVEPPVPPVVKPVEVQPPQQTEPTVVIVQEPTQPQVVDTDGDGVPDHRDACPGTPRNLVVDNRGCPVQVPVEDNLRLELRVFFDNDKSIIKPQYRNEVAKVAEAMREYPNATAQIEGHASKTGPSARYNQRLSEARANAVKSMLSKEFGIAPNRLSAVGYGYDRPIAPNNTAEGRAQNRRVYAVIQGTNVTTVNQTIDMQ